MIVLDTTILQYAVGTEHPLRQPCRRLLQAHANGLIEATTTVEVVQEFTHFYARRRSRVAATSLARSYIAAFALLQTQAGDLELGLDLFQRCPDIGAFDAVLAAVALNNQAEALISADRAFSRVPNLNWIDVATSAVDNLLEK